METCDHVFYRNLRKVYPVADRAEGVYIWDTEGRCYLDGSSGAMVCNIGHSNPAVLAAMRETFLSSDLSTPMHLPPGAASPGRHPGLKG